MTMIRYISADTRTSSQQPNQMPQFLTGTDHYTITTQHQQSL